LTYHPAAGGIGYRRRVFRVARQPGINAKAAPNLPQRGSQPAAFRDVPIYDKQPVHGSPNKSNGKYYMPEKQRYFLEKEDNHWQLLQLF
jgi:hypothetical protein